MSNRAAQLDLLGELGAGAPPGHLRLPAGSAANNGADIFRAGVDEKGGSSYRRVDWTTLTDPSVPIAEWTFDTDNDAAGQGLPRPTSAPAGLPAWSRAPSASAP